MDLRDFNSTPTHTHLQKRSEIDIPIVSTGLLEIRPGFKAYTQTHVLEANEIGPTSNYFNPVPNYNIVQDDCFQKKEEILNVSSVQLETIRFSNIKLDELKYANHKLKHFDDILQEQLNKPTQIHHSNWFISGLSAIGSIVALALIYLCLRFCGCLQLCRRFLCCLTKSRKYDDCCTRIFNTNIVSANPAKRMQLSRILRNQEYIDQETDDDAGQPDLIEQYQPKTPRFSR